jgi:hypothetical protein
LIVKLGIFLLLAACLQEPAHDLVHGVFCVCGLRAVLRRVEGNAASASPPRLLPALSTPLPAFPVTADSSTAGIGAKVLDGGSLCCDARLEGLVGHFHRAATLRGRLKRFPEGSAHLLVTIKKGALKAILNESRFLYSKWIVWTVM